MEGRSLAAQKATSSCARSQPPMPGSANKESVYAPTIKPHDTVKRFISSKFFIHIRFRKENYCSLNIFLV